MSEHDPLPSEGAKAGRLTHVYSAGAAHMVDVSAKQPSARTAVATGVVRTTAEVIAALRANSLAQGDALAAARNAGTMAAKRAPDRAPPWPPHAIPHAAVEFSVRDVTVEITATVSTTDRTGVEMEALTAVTVAGVALHDMIEAVDPAAGLDAVRVERKDGGKTGSWTRPAGR